MFERITAALVRLAARLRAVDVDVRRGEVERALREDGAVRGEHGASAGDAQETAARARAAADAARQARRERE